MGAGGTVSEISVVLLNPETRGSAQAVPAVDLRSSAGTLEGGKSPSFGS